jgi:hypothetical protein
MPSDRFAGDGVEYRLPPCAKGDVEAAVAAATLNPNDKDGMRNLPPGHYPGHHAVLCIHDEGRSPIWSCRTA